MISLWVDDEREEPDGWVRAFTAAEAIGYLESGQVSALSLDHDLGEGSDKGTTITYYLEEQDYMGNDLWPKEIYIHSSNGVGRGNMERAIDHCGHYGYKRSGITNGIWSGIDGYMRNDQKAAFKSQSASFMKRCKDLYFI